jgi:ArsR family metal-binding transcriptional regulator
MNVKELTLEQIEQCIKDNIKITDWHLRDGVIGAVMDAIALFAKKNNMLEGSLPEPVVEAYGWLWHDISVNPRTQKARQLLGAIMTKEQMRVGIEMAKEAGAKTRDRSGDATSWV